MKSLVLSLSLIAFSAHAADDAQMRNLENRVSALEQRKGGGGIILPSAGANLENDIGICLDAELLIWKAHQTGMNFAQNIIDDSFTTDTNPYLKPNFRFDPGVRVQVGLRPTHDDWEIDAVWTHFYTKAKRDYENTQTPLVVLFLNNDQLTPSSSIYSTWRVNLNMIDLELSRASFLSKWTSIKPYLSIRNAWLHQKYNLTSIPSNTAYETQMRSDLWCIGPRAGFELKFGMGEGFYFFGDASASLLWGFFKNSQASVLDTTRVPRNIDVHTSTYNADISLGLGWDKRFDDNQYRISIRGAWEHLVFFDTNYFVSSARLDSFLAFDTPRGNFTTEGFTLAFRFDF